MAPKSTSSKVAKAQDKKSENESKKQAVASAAKEAKEAEDWSKGAKGKSKVDEKADKLAQAAARKAEAARLLAEEEASLPSKPKGKAVASTASSSSKAPSTSTSVDSPNPSISRSQKQKERAVDEIPSIESFSATGLDDALDAMNLVNEKTDKSSLGSKAQQSTDAHPERRFKAAFEAYKTQELPQAKIDYPGLRLQQYHELLYKAFQKSPDNPFNQLTVAYNTNKEEKVEVLKKQREDAKSRLQDD